LLFNSPEFFLFFVIVVLGAFLCPFRFRWAFLLAGSYFFYMWWRWEYIFLIVAQTIVNFHCGRFIARSKDQGSRRLWLVVALVCSLGLLFFFKYYGFAARSLEGAGNLIGVGFDLPGQDILLPVGISFYTFQALSYSIDIYRNRIEEERHLGRFALFIAFFPQLVAGPIERASNLLKQFRRETRPEVERISSGLALILWGLFKKVVIADRLAIYVNLIYGDPHAQTGLSLLVATYFFAFQIYCDFSGYSDIAIGAARILGYDLMQNFRLPYLAESITDFWRRWHISLSTWFRDYVYLPLGGNRVTSGRWAANIIIVFGLSGLWHGANWTFLVWGLLHGFYYLAERVVGPSFVRACNAIRLQGLPLRFLRIVLTFHLVLLAWVFFRAQSVTDAFFIIGRILADPFGRFYPGPSQLTTFLGMALILFLVAVQILQSRGAVSLYFSGIRWPLLIRWPSYAALIFGMAIFGISNNEFIYFQF
jgi:alginate O-acetyltransferase complex protein AlgI